jgi:hypothetical protein
MIKAAAILLGLPLHRWRIRICLTDGACGKNWRRHVRDSRFDQHAGLSAVTASVAREITRICGRLMKRPLGIACLAISMVPVYANAQQPEMAKLKADAQKVVGIISHDKAKSQIYCQVTDLGQQIDQEKDRKKAGVLVEKMNELEKQLGPEYLELLKTSKDVDPTSKDGEDIISMFDELDEACPE